MSSIYAKIHKSVIVLLLFLLIRDEHVIALFVLKWYAAYLQTVLIDAVGVSVISYIHTKLGYWQNRSLSTRRGENTSESWSSVWLACRNGESSRIFREEKDWTTRPRSCWRITARNESAWTTRYRSCANETWALSDAQTPHLASLGHSAGRVIIDPSSLFVSKITVKVMGFRLLQNGSYLPG